MLVNDTYIDYTSLPASSNEAAIIVYTITYDSGDWIYDEEIGQSIEVFYEKIDRIFHNLEDAKQYIAENMGNLTFHIYETLLF